MTQQNYSCTEGLQREKKTLKCLCLSPVLNPALGYMRCCSFKEIQMWVTLRKGYMMHLMQTMRNKEFSFCAICISVRLGDLGVASWTCDLVLAQG